MTTSEEKKDLLPCPFCGSSTMLEELGDHHGAYHNLGCSKRECPAHHAIYTESEAPVEDSVNWWNTRAALQESEAGTVAKVVRNSAGQIVMQNGEGGYFDISQYVGESFYLAPPSAQAIETAAIIKCVEICRAEFNHTAANKILALVPQDGRTQLEQKCMEVANAAFDFGYYDCESPAVDCVEPKLRAIVTNLIGAAK